MPQESYSTIHIYSQRLDPTLSDAKSSVKETIMNGKGRGRPPPGRPPCFSFRYLDFLFRMASTLTIVCQLPRKVWCVMLWRWLMVVDGQQLDSFHKCGGIIYDSSLLAFLPILNNETSRPISLASETMWLSNDRLRTFVRNSFPVVSTLALIFPPD